MSARPPSRIDVFWLSSVVPSAYAIFFFHVGSFVCSFSFVHFPLSLYKFFFPLLSFPSDGQGQEALFYQEGPNAAYGDGTATPDGQRRAREEKRRRVLCVLVLTEIKIQSFVYFSSFGLLIHNNMNDIRLI